jgi:hypothetical protein
MAHARRIYIFMQQKISPASFRLGAAEMSKSRDNTKWAEPLDHNQAV